LIGPSIAVLIRGELDQLARKLLVARRRAWLLRLRATTGEPGDSDRGNEMLWQAALHSFALSITCRSVIGSQIN
jgi:hypothetical protein